MSRDDYISKLFIKNQDKLEQPPSNDLWAQMELQLDQDLPVTQSSTASTGASTKVIGLSKYLAAASVLVVLASVTYMFRSIETSTMDQTVFAEPLAIYTDASDTEEDAYESYTDLPANIEQEKAEEEVQQAENIVEAVATVVLGRLEPANSQLLFRETGNRQQSAALRPSRRRFNNVSHKSCIHPY